MTAVASWWWGQDESQSTQDQRQCSYCAVQQPAASGSRTRQFNTVNTKACHLHDPEPATSTSRLHILLPWYPSSHSMFQELCRPILFAHFLYPMLATCPAHHFVFFFITVYQHITYVSACTHMAAQRRWRAPSVRGNRLPLLAPHCQAWKTRQFVQVRRLACRTVPGAARISVAGGAVEGSWAAVCRWCWGHASCRACSGSPPWWSADSGSWGSPGICKTGSPEEASFRLQSHYRPTVPCRRTCLSYWRAASWGCRSCSRNGTAWRRCHCPRTPGWGSHKNTGQAL